MKTISTADLVTAINEVLSIDVDERAREAGVETDTLALRHISFDSLAILELGILLEEVHDISVNPAIFPLTASATVEELRDFINAQQHN
jgi:acyl carrier protein